MLSCFRGTGYPDQKVRNVCIHDPGSLEGRIRWQNYVLIEAVVVGRACNQSLTLQLAFLTWKVEECHLPVQMPQIRCLAWALSRLQCCLGAEPGMIQEHHPVLTVPQNPSSASGKAASYQLQLPQYSMQTSQEMHFIHLTDIYQIVIA